MDKLTDLWMFLRRHKYAFVLFLFILIIGVLDENSLIRRWQYQHEENQLREEILKYRAEYEENTARLNELMVDSGAMERVARERYLMKKPNEDIFVFEGEEGEE